MFYRQITWNSETLEILLRIPSSYSGPADKLCGASGGQKAAFKQAQKTSQSLSNLSELMASDAQLIFGKDQHILDSIMGALEPVVDKGANQYGFSSAEDAALRTQATANLAAAGRNTTNAVRSAVAANGGMNLPSGSEAAIEGSLAENEAQKQADAQLQITKEGYQTGRQNFFAAEGAAASAPGALENPAIAASNAAVGAGNAAMGAAQENIQDQTQLNDLNNAWVAPVTGAIGGAAKVAGGMLGIPV